MDIEQYKVICGYCGKPARYLKSSAPVYRGIDYGPVWACSGKCDAYVGAHPDGSPLGRLANKELRQAKMAVHKLFDPLWQNFELAYPGARSSGHIKQVMRSRAYRWLATQMQITPAECHIGMFDVEQCHRAVAIIQEHKPTSATIRAWAKALKAAA